MRKMSATGLRSIIFDQSIGRNRFVMAIYRITPRILINMKSIFQKACYLFVVVALAGSLPAYRTFQCSVVEHSGPAISEANKGAPCDESASQPTHASLSIRTTPTSNSLLAITVNLAGPTFRHSISPTNTIDRSEMPNKYPGYTLFLRI
jgi:hypothetical protein